MAHTLDVVGCGGELPKRQAQLFVGNSGTTIRFLTAALAACRGRFVLDGVERMRERPIGELIKALSGLGARIVSTNDRNPDCPPVEIEARGLSGGETTISGSVSSQFLSGLMMAAPLASSDVVIHVADELVSLPYVEMTAAVMRSFGAEVARQDRTISVSNRRRYSARSYSIEPDASAASYFWAAAAITGGRSRVLGLNRESLQGDVRFCEVLAHMGCDVKYGSDFIEVRGRPLNGVDVVMSDISDTVQTLAAVAVFADGPTTVRGVAHNRVKETDRISDLARELRKVGVAIEEFEDGLRITPSNRLNPAEFHTYDDHRMAMSLALIGLRLDGTVVLDPDCTAKTYPDYWGDLAAFSGSRIERFD